ncbi:putative uncharacterized phage protein [Aliivibrio wodanis]|uniref:Uncharacterized phage protein n=1 Tax=Aliivibrio wodanis TaxID=80852 RepID=A0A090IMB9_9GAMM|nr:putative uncharacterized phage protein [Aliivibrio wodanis]
MQIAEGKKIALVAPSNGFVKDIPCVVGALLVVPSFSAKENEVVTCTYSGYYDGPIKAGDTLSFNCEAAYFDGGVFTKVQPTTSGEVEQPVGVFIDGGVLLTGELITQLVA